MNHWRGSKCVFAISLYVLGCVVFARAFINKACVWAWGGFGGMQAPIYISQELVVQYRPEATFVDISKTYQDLGLYEVRYSPYSGLRTVRVLNNSSVYTVAANLNQTPSVAYAEPNYFRKTNFTPNDPLYKYQWHLNEQIMRQAWDLSFGTNIIVAVLDTGVAYRNGGGFAQAPDLAETIFISGYDFVNDDQYPDDDNRHGTHTAGVIAQSTNNLKGGCGVAPDCTIMPVKVLDKTGSGNVADIVEAIYFAVNNGAHVINMSYGFVTSPSASEEEAINYAVSQGVTVICSAGNDATNEPHYPSSYETSICVTSTKYDHSFAGSYSNYGPEVDICAPGGDLQEDVNGDGYPDGIYQQTHNGVNYKQFDFYFAEGTSCSSAFVTGVVALMMARASQPLTPNQVRQILQTTAIDLGEPGWDEFYGWGLVNPLAAVQAAATYNAAGQFVPGIRIPQISNPSSNPSTPYYTQNTAYQASIAPRTVQVTASNSNYRVNAGFQSIGQTFGTGAQALNTQPIPPYQAQGVFWPNIWQYPNTTTVARGLLSPAFPPPLTSALFQLPQQPIANNSYVTASSAGYQTEAVFSQAFLPYQAQQWNTTITRPQIPVSFPNVLFPLSDNIYPFWLYIR